MRPLVMILFSPVGHGHRSAALNLAEAIRRLRPDAEVEVRDVLEFAPRWFRYDLVWRLIQQHGAWVWDRLFTLTDRPMPAAFNWLREGLNLRLLAPLAAELLRRQPDHIVCTHYLPAVSVGALTRARLLRGRSSVVITDYLAHQAWIEPRAERYYVATQEVASALTACGVRATSIAATGIPIAREMSEPHPNAEPARLPVWLRVLFLASGVPRRQVREALESLAGRNELELQIVTGGDSKRRRLLARWVVEFGLRATVHDLVPTLQPLMDEAGVVVTKAGGLVVSECIARGRAIVLPWPAPGHERGNRAHVLAVGAGRALDEAKQLGALLSSLAHQRPELVGLSSAGLSLANRGHAADSIALDLFAERDATHRPAVLHYPPATASQELAS